MKFDRLAQRTTPEGVYVMLRDAILSGELPGGAALREAHIADDMGVSRSPVREALNKLEDAGLVLKVPFRGAFVAQVSEKTMIEIASLRYLVEPFATKLSLPVLRSSQRLQFEQIVNDLTDACARHEPAAITEAHLAFHRSLYINASHELLHDLWAAWESKLRLSMAAEQRTVVDTIVASAHADLAQLILTSDDNDEIAAAVAQHVHAGPLQAMEFRDLIGGRLSTAADRRAAAFD